MKRDLVLRAARKSAVVCAALVSIGMFVLAISLSARAEARPEPHAPRTLAGVAKDGHDRAIRGDVRRDKLGSVPTALHDSEGSILAFPPRADVRAPITVVYLHGIHGRAENGCPWLHEGASELGWLVCPSANTHLSNDTYSWGGSLFDQRAVVARAERAAQANGADAQSANVLVGFSQGAYVAVDLVRAGLGRYRGLVLIGAEVAPDRATLDRAGVKRVVLGAGELDASFGPLQRAAKQLERAGVDVHFLDLGAIGHSYQTTNKGALADAIAWSGQAP